MTRTDPEQCQLCGNTDRRDLRWSLIKWAEAEPGMAYEHIGRCSSEDACRQRVAALGERWPLLDKRTAA